MSASTENLLKNRVALVVESDPSLRRLTSTILRQTGYHVHESQTDDDSETFQAEETSLELLVVGMNLPGGANGFQVAKKVWQKNPATRIIITGASNPDDQDMRMVRDAGMTFLSLPFSFGRLSRAASAQSSWTSMAEAG